MSDIKDLFVSYEIAKQLKDKGFDEECIGYYDKVHNDIVNQCALITNDNSLNILTAPLYQQVVDWFREKYNVIITVQPRDKKFIGVREYFISDVWRFNSTDKFSNYYEALTKAIEEAIKLIDKKEFKKGGDIESKKNKETMSDKNEIFEEIADYGDQMYFTRDFGHVIISEEDDKEIPLVLVAEISDYYEATGEDEFKEKPFVISIDIYPRIDFIDKAHIESCAQSAGIEPEEVGYTDLKSYGLGIPLLLKDLEEGFESMELAEEFIKSDDLMKKLNSKSMLIGFFMDGAINRNGDSRWKYLEYAISKEKGFY